MNPRASRDTLQDADETPDNTCIITTSDVPDEESSSTSLPSAVKVRKTKSGKTQSAATKEEIMVECLKVMRTPAPSIQPSPSAESTFAAYITEKLKRLDSRRRIIAENRISDTLWELEMEMEQSMTTASDLAFPFSQPLHPMAGGSQLTGTNPAVGGFHF